MSGSIAEAMNQASKFAVTFHRILANRKSDRVPYVDPGRKLPTSSAPGARPVAVVPALIAANLALH
jgi:hypothetical protein